MLFNYLFFSSIYSFQLLILFNYLFFSIIYSFNIKLNEIGMIENSGFPDQTYDIWTATGVHAYCGVRSFLLHLKIFVFFLLVISITHGSIFYKFFLEFEFYFQFQFCYFFILSFFYLFV